MATTPVPAFAAPPDFPALSDRAAGTYNSKAYAWAEAMQDTTGPNIHAIAVTAKANADDGALSATAAAAQVPLAAAQVALATTQAQLAADAANAASATAGATKWVSDTAYTAGYCVWSPVNQQVYRRKTAGAGTIDPSADLANWTFVGAKPAIPRSTRTSNTMIGAADNSTLIDITSGTFTQTFDAAATLGSGWFCYLRNSGTGDVTLDPNGAETIDGLADFVMYPNEVRLVQCDGSALRTVVLNSFYRAFITSGTFKKPPGYRAFHVELWGGGGSGRQGATYTTRGGGGGGGCAVVDIASTALASSTSFTVGAGAAGKAIADTNGTAGGGSVFAGITAFGGSGGTDAVDTSNGAGGDVFYLQNKGPSTPSHPILGASYSRSSVFGGGAGYPQGISAGMTVYGGRGGTALDSSNTQLSSTTVFGGAGGGVATAGSAPGGGGGASTNGTASGAGARGELRIWGVI